jgi:hypothetical protein
MFGVEFGFAAPYLTSTFLSGGKYPPAATFLSAIGVRRLPSPVVPPVPIGDPRGNPPGRKAHRPKETPDMTRSRDPKRSVPRPTHVQFDPKTGKYMVARQESGIDPKGYDTLGEALAAASRGRT